MKLKWSIAVLALSILFAGTLVAGSVYYWTDENGVRHFSNTGLPDEVNEAQVRPEVDTPQPVPDSEDAADTPGGPPPEPPPEQGEAENPPPGKGQSVDDRLAARAEVERKRLESEIKRIEGLSIGKSFTQGMKDARVRPLKEQLALLEADPERYFRMKRQGAFNSSSASESGSSAPGDSPAGMLSGEPARSSTGRSPGQGSAAPAAAKENISSGDTSSDSQKSKGTRSRGSSGTDSLYTDE